MPGNLRVRPGAHNSITSNAYQNTLEAAFASRKLERKEMFAADETVFAYLVA
jgi:hypothetical protein